MGLIRRVLCCLALLFSPVPLLAQSAPGAFTSGTRYDLAGRVTGTIGGAPFGTAGPFAATRSSYDGLGNLASVEEGQLAGWQDETVSPASWASFSVLRTRTYGYDGYGRKVIEQLHAGGASGQVASVTQYSYDLYGRVVCTAVRMDPAQWGGQGDPCAAQTNGPNGPDRITRTSYDYLGNVLVVQRAVGTSIQQNYETYTWNTTTGGAGKPATVADANGNLTSYTYGKTALNLLGQANFPSPTAAGQSSGSDYEAYDYDANGNRTSLRKRDGRTIGYAYDALNRVVSKTYPNGGARAVYYAYDLLGHQTAARFDGPGGGDAVLTGWDAFGEQLTSTTAMAGISRTLGHGYNADGSRVGLTWPDGHVVDYNRYDTGQLYYTNQSGVGPLFHTPMDGYGRVQATYRWGYGPWTWSFATFYGYDGVSRPLSTTHALAGGVGNVTDTFGYNPASQIVSDARDNDAYAFTGYVTVDRPYGVNGLNQYTSAGSATFGYDANGNLTSDGTNSWSYDVENRLVSSSGGAQLTYDPLGRLWQTAGTGTGTTQFLYDGDALVAEYDGSGTMLKRYVHGDGADVPEVQYAGAQVTSPTYLFADHQGSIVAQTDASGNETQIDTYDEYGIPGAGNAGRFQYTGQAWLPELGMYYYKARIYSPTLGRFMQTDPIGYKDQINLYAYVTNDPIDNRDPTGLQCARVEGTCTAEQSKQATEAVIKMEHDHPTATKVVVGLGLAAMTAGTATVAEGGVAATAEAVALTEARAGAVAAGESGATGGATSGLVTRSGEVFRGASTRAGGPGMPTNPAVRAAADAVPRAARSDFHGCCGEVNAMSRAANAGAKLEGSVVATVRAVGRSAGELMRACGSCRAIAHSLGVTLLDP